MFVKFRKVHIVIMFEFQVSKADVIEYMKLLVELRAGLQDVESLANSLLF